MDDKVLVTGGSGFLGSALVKRLVKIGKNVIVLDNGSRGKESRLKEIINQITYLEGDVTDEKFVKKATFGCNTVFHLAFINGTKFFYEQPRAVLSVGVKGALASIEAAESHGTKTYIMASSSEVYQQPENIPTSETERAIIPDVLNPRFSYAGGKLISELLTINYFRDSVTRDMIFRPHNVFGEDMGFEHVVPEIVEKLYLASHGWKRKNVKIEIQGSGEETRAFCYIDDAIDQIMALYTKGEKGEIYHVGIDQEISISSLIENIAKILNLEVEIVPGILQPGSTTRRCPDIGKIRSLGYTGKSSFFEGLKKTVEWYKTEFERI